MRSNHRAPTSVRRGRLGLRLTGPSLLLLLGVNAAACGDDTDTTPNGGGGASAGPSIVIDLVVDANRDGVANGDDAADQDGEEAWSATAGAMFLPNLDDDDGDEVRDADDNVYNGGADALDLIAFRVSACPDCPTGSKGTITIDGASAANVRIFALDVATQSTWTLVGGELGPCNEVDETCQQQANIELTSEEVQAGLLLAIEGRDVIRDNEGAWTGLVELSYAIVNDKGEALTSAENPDGVDRATLRVAPWILFGNLSPFDRVWSSSDSGQFVAGIREATDDAGITYERYGNWNDQWTQDFFQTGYFAIPALDAEGQLTVHGMMVANARPWGRTNTTPNLPITWLNNNYLGPDQATLVVYEEPHTGDSFDSHGNHDLIPPYSNGGDDFPLGRILIGTGVLPETKTFYNAQGAQSPYYVADTNWLLVGHVDEYLSFVPANTPRGWKMLVASPRMSRQMLEDAQTAGHGAVVVHEGKQWLDGPAAITIDELLADVAIMAASQDAQSYIDEEVDKLKTELGLADDEVIEMPFLFDEQIFFGDPYKIAYQPGTVNALVFGDYIVMAKPFGPVIDGEDIFETDLRERLGNSTLGLGADGEGLEVYFTDDWNLYHRLDGEVHCGTNPDASAPYSSVNWWETGR